MPIPTFTFAGFDAYYWAPALVAIAVVVAVLLFVYQAGQARSRSVKLPNAKAADLEFASATPLKKVPSGPTVLIVDDSQLVRVALTKVLESAKMRVLQAVDGLDAQQVLDREYVDVVISDLEMPRMDGFEFIAFVRGHLDTENLPIIAITGSDELHQRVGSIQGLYGIFRKPWNDRELVRRITDVANIRRSHDNSRDARL